MPVTCPFRHAEDARRRGSAAIRRSCAACDIRSGRRRRARKSNRQTVPAWRRDPSGSVRPPSFFPINSSGRIAENVENLRARKGISRIGVQSDHQIGETVHQAAGEFLLAVQAALHFALLGDVHERSLIPHKFAGRIADHRRRVQGDDFAPVLLVLQGDFAGAQESKLIQPGAFSLAIRGVPVERRKVQLQEVFLACEPQHLRQRRDSLR